MTKDIHETTKNHSYFETWKIARLPTIMCRLSPFFPISRSKLGESSNEIKNILIENSWGSVLYNGPLLSVIDEDVFLAILYRLEYNTLGNHATVQRRNSTTEVQDTFYQIVKALGMSKSKRSREIIKQSIRKMQNAHFYTIDNSKDAYLTTSLFLSSTINEYKILNMTIDSDFYDRLMCYQRSTKLHLEWRRLLKSQVAKAIYRFVCSHSHKKWTGGLKPLGEAINLDQSQPLWRWKSIVKPALKELKEKNIFEDTSFINKKNIAKLEVKKDFRGSKIKRPR